MRHFKHLFLMILMIAVLLCDSGFVLAEVPKTPQTFKEAGTMGKEILWGLPQALRNPWQEAMAVWGKMGSWFGNNVWQRIYSFLGKEVEKRKPEVKEEFEKEKQEMREEIPKVSKSLWERFRELIR